MPLLLTTVVSKVASVPNPENAALLQEFHQFMKQAGSSENHQRNELYSNILFAIYLNDKSFFQLSKTSEITEFLNTKRKSKEIDPDEKWKTTWNDYLHSVKFFIRWLYNHRGREQLVDPQTWQTPEFAKIRDQKSKRLSPYTESEIWDKEDIILVIKYATHLRNKAALSLFWDLDARNHEVTGLKIKNIKLSEKYGEGEIPHDTKTGGGPILLTLSFPHVRDWLNLHPFRQNPDARVICSLKNGAPVRSTAMWQMMQQLRDRIARLIRQDEIRDAKEVERLQELLRTKRWNPYCIRHSAITYDSDSLPEFALRKKVRWTMNSEQPARYVKRRMGNSLKMQILAREGIITDAKVREKPTVVICPKCERVNAVDVKYCTNAQCSYPLMVEAYNEIKAKELKKDEMLETIYKALIERGILKND